MDRAPSSPAADYAATHAESAERRFGPDSAVWRDARDARSRQEHERYVARFAAERNLQLELANRPWIVSMPTLLGLDRGAGASITPPPPSSIAPSGFAASAPAVSVAAPARRVQTRNTFAVPRPPALPPPVDDFSAGLVNWTTSGDVTTASEEAILADATADRSIMYRAFALDPGDYFIDVDLANGLSDTFDSGSFPDVFFASMYFTDDLGTFSITGGIYSSSFGLVDLDFLGPYNVNAFLSASVKGAGWFHLQGQFTTTNTYAIVAFELADLNGVAGDSAVRVDNVEVSVVPEPATLLLACVGILALGAARRRMLVAVLLLAWVGTSWGQGMTNISPHCFVVTTNERTTVERGTGIYVTTVDAKVYNLGGRICEVPMHCVVNVTTGGITVVGASGGYGTGPYGMPYFDVSAQLPDGSFDQDDVITLPLQFRRSRDVNFTYSVVPWGGVRLTSPPSLAVNPLVYNVNEGGSLAISVTALDPDTNDLVTLGGGPDITNATFSATSGAIAVGTFLFNPDFDQAGTYTVKFTARDPGGLMDTEDVLITVSNVNRSPTLQPVEPRTVSEGDLLVVEFDVADPDGDVFQWVLPTLPSNAVFAPETGTFVFAPDFSQAGAYNLPFAVSDGSLTSATQSLTITVVDVPASPPSSTNAFTLQVDPIISPTLGRNQRVTGTVNGSTNGPPREPSKAALITGLVPSTGLRGQTLDVVITGLNNGLFATQFSSNSVASFGPDIVVNSNTVVGATQLVANITIPLDTPTGPRDVTVATGGELAISVIAFNVSPGTTSLTGKLLDPDTGLPIAGAIVTVQGTGFQTTTAPDGSFTLNGVPPGRGTLVINPPNHELLTLSFTAENGVVADLGDVKSPPTVFDPSAPASVSLLSVIGRGLGGFTVTDPEAAKQAMRDAMVLVGGSEAGVIDAFGNQLNPALDGYGLLSLRDDGLRILGDGMGRGESVGLADVLYAFSHAFVWTNGAPLTLEEWIDGLQERLNAAWVDPRNPSNALPLIIFNRGNTLGPRPPVLQPETRLNAFQTFLFVHSMLSYAFDPAGTTVVASVISPPTMSPSFPWIASAYADPPPGTPSAGRRWTSYWRGFDSAKQNFITGQLNAAGQEFVELSAFMLLLAGTGDLTASLIGLPIIGAMENNIVSAFASISFAARVPAAPRMDRAEIVPGPNGAPRVRVHFKPSAGEAYDGLMLHALYRFRAPNEGRQLVALDSFRSPPNAASGTVYLTDLAPFPGSTFYAVSAIKLRSVDDLLTETQINNTSPWWNVLTQGKSDVLQGLIASRQRLVSDYSDPAVIFVGSASTTIPVSDIEVDPLTDDVFYSDEGATGGAPRILRSADLGDGEATDFVFTGFAAPGHEGLGIDSDGNLYTLNAASQAKFGGRLFRFDAGTGNRSHVGQVNYFSRDLQFANPTDAYVPTIGPPASGLPGDEDLYIVDMLDGFLKRAPVRATYDPFRRVAQPYVFLPYSGKPIDMEHDDEGNTYLLLADARPRKEFRDREKGTMHIPPGAPVKQSDCPEDADVFADPVYPFSGEFYESVEDLRLKGRGLDFVWNRKYRSKIGVGTNSVQGNNWDYSYNIFLTRNTNTGGIVVYDGNTRSDEYAKSGTNDLWTLPEFFRELKRNGDGTYTLEFEDKGVWNFHGFTGAAVDGRVKESIDRHGNRLQFFYDGLGRLERVNDTLGRNIFVVYNGDGRIDHLLDFSGRITRYEYFGAGDPNGNPGDLKAVITPAVTGTPTTNNFPSGKRISYTYSTGFTNAALNGNLLTITDGRRNDTNDVTFGRGPYVRNVYSTTGDVNAFTFDRVVRQVWGNEGDIIDFVYVEVQPTRENGGAVSKTIINDRVGNVLEYFYNGQNQCTLRRIYTGRANASLPTTDTQNRPTGKVRDSDPDYFETKYVWNADSLKTREIHPNGNITEWVYESDLDAQAPARTRANIRIIRHLQGTHSVTGDQQVIEERFEYDTSFGRGCCGFNFVTRETDGRGNDTRKYYDAVGNLTSVVHRITGITETYRYNSFGQMTNMVHPADATGHRRVDAMSYYGPGDGAQNGYLRQVVVDQGFLNLATTYDYDARGNVVRMTNPRGLATEYIVNQLDQVVRTTTPVVTNGAVHRYFVDAYFDANNNQYRTDIANIDEQGVLDATNPFISTINEFDILNNVTRRSKEVGTNTFAVTDILYDRNRNVVEIRYGEAVAGRQARNTVKTYYDERNLVYRQVSAEGDPTQSTTQIDYDRNGNIVGLTTGLEDADPHTATTEFDAFDRKVRETDAMGNVSSWQYDANGNVVALRVHGELVDVDEGAGNVLLAESFYSYDALNRMTNSTSRQFDPATQLPLDDGLVVTTREYSDKSQLIRVVDDNGHVQRMAYDTLGRHVLTEDHLSNTVVQAYDGNNNIVSITTTERSATGGAPRVFVTSNVYDNVDRLIASIDSATNITRMTYDSRSNLRRKVDPRGNVLDMQYDGMNRLVRSVAHLTDTGAGGGVVVTQIVHTQAWDDSSRLVSRADGAGNATRFDHDPLNRAYRTVLPDGKAITHTINPHGNIVRTVDPNGSVVTQRYDRLDRLVRVDVSRASGVTGTTFEVHAYDGLRRPVRAEDDDSVVTWTYDSLSRKLTETRDGLSTVSSYDGMGNRRRLQYPGGRVISNSFDALDRVTDIWDGALVARYSYDGAARAVERLNGNSTAWRLEYDAARRVVRSTHVRNPGGPVTTIDDRSFGWDRVHNKTFRADLLAGVTHSYSYDSVNRLVRTDITTPESIAYVLDLVGNRVSVAGGADAGSYALSSVTPEPADRQRNQYTATPSDTRTYDANGNLTIINAGLPNERRLAYDYRNRLVSWRHLGTGQQVEFAYDALGRRIRKSSTGPVSGVMSFLYDGDRVIEERDGGTNVLATYVFGNYTDERISMTRGGQTYYYHADDLHNVMLMTDAAGSVVERYEYGDYGAPRVFNAGGTPIAGSAIGNPYLFTGREYDLETGLYNYRTRYLDPQAGRFISADSIGAWGDPGNMGNAYSYIGNNPWSATDPSGMNPIQMAGGFAAGLYNTVGDLVSGLAGLPGLLMTNPSDFCTAMMGMMDKIFSEPNGPFVGLARVLAPEVFRDWLCWNSISDYRKGRVMGRVLGEVLLTLATAGGGSAVKGAGKTAGIVDAMHSASLSTRTGEVFSLTDDMVNVLKVDMLDSLRGMGLSDLARLGESANLRVLSQTDMATELTRLGVNMPGGRTVGGLYCHQSRTVFLNAEVMFEGHSALGVFAHELVHHADNITGVYRNTAWGKMAAEVRAHAVQAFVDVKEGARAALPKHSELFQTVKDGYSPGYLDSVNRGALTMGDQAADYSVTAFRHLFAPE